MTTSISSIDLLAMAMPAMVAPVMTLEARPDSLGCVVEVAEARGQCLSFYTILANLNATVDVAVARLLTRP